MASKVKGGASPKSGTLSLKEMQEFNKLYPKDRRLSTKELKAIADGLREINLNKGGSPMKKKTKYMAKGGYGTPTKKMVMKAGGATKKTKYMAKGGMKKTKYMAKGGAGMKKTKMYSRGGAAKKK